MPEFIGFLQAFDYFIIFYLTVYNSLHILFLVICFMDVRFWVARKLWEDIERVYNSPFLPSITLLVPAYNEEVTITESLYSLLNLHYPKYEIVIVNDGSKDATVEVLKRDFGFVATEIEYHPYLPCQHIRGLYEAKVPEGSDALRMVLIDKANGGKADALNAAINAATGTYVCSMDADSMLPPNTLLQLVLPILEDVNQTMAVGGQVVPSNGCVVEGGQLHETGIPRTWIARFQLVEYIRSFTQNRTALSRYNSVLILSGVCAVFQREMVMNIGGFLTNRMTNKIGIEYCGIAQETVCEDMEVILRLHRYLLDTGIPGRVIFLPIPIAWTEVPEEILSLGKQRSRWYRGLWECLSLHKEVLFRPRFKQIGLFSLPYQLLFEAMSPLIEFVGYLLVPITWYLGILDLRFCILFLLNVLGLSLLISILSVAISLWSEGRYNRGAVFAGSLLPFTARDLFVILFDSILLNLGYRQYIVYYQLKGFKDFLAGRKSWDKFARKGFQKK